MMRSNAGRAALALAAIAAVIVLFVVLNGDDDGGSSSQTTTQAQQRGATSRGGEGGNGGGGQTTTGGESLTEPVTITVKDGKPAGGIKKLEYKKGERVRFVVESDVSDEVHVHGYDRSNFVKAGGTARFDFVANLEGVFEIELESRSEQIAELRVTPS